MKYNGAVFILPHSVDIIISDRTNLQQLRVCPGLSVAAAAYVAVRSVFSTNFPPENLQKTFG